MKDKLRQLKHYLLPHEGNKFKPSIFAKESVVAITLVILLIEGAYQLQINVVIPKTNFLAAVLPAVLTDLTNNDRTENNVQTLMEDPLLNKAAQNKAKDMASKSYFSHISPDGKTPWYWINAVGYQYTYAGENLAIDFTDSKEVQDAWMKSPTHHANIIKSEYTRVGYGVAQGIYEGRDTTFVVEFFATPRTKASTIKTKVAPKESVNVPAGVLTTTEVPNTNVLGTQTMVVSGVQDSSVNTGTANIFMVVATSPRHIIFYIIGSITLFFTFLFVLSFFFHVRKRYIYIEFIIGGITLLILGYGLLIFNGSAPSVNLPHDDRASNVSPSL